MKEQHDSAIRECEQKSRDYCERMRNEMRNVATRADRLQRELDVSQLFPPSEWSLFTAGLARRVQRHACIGRSIGDRQ